MSQIHIRESEETKANLPKRWVEQLYVGYTYEKIVQEVCIRSKNEFSS